MSVTLLAVIAAVAGLAALLRRRRPADPPDEPWRQSLDEGDDEPLDLESIRRAEEEFLAEGGAEDDDEPWR